MSYSQYSNLEFNKIVDAAYLENMKENFLIDALPRPLSTEEIIKLTMKRNITYKQEKSMDSIYRTSCIHKLSSIFIPTNSSIDVFKRFDSVLRDSYRKRGLNKVIYNTEMNEVTDDIRKKNNTIFDMSSDNLLSSDSNGFLIVGTSGGGKTRAIKTTLNYYPQVIIHKNILYEPLRFYQIVYIYVDCSIDASVKELCIKIINRIDEALLPIRKQIKTDSMTYAKQFLKSRTNTEQLMEIIRYLIIRHRIGAIIIDEIQHLTGFKSSQKFLNFVISLSNITKIPIIYIGTNKFLKGNITGNFKWSRRITGSGDIRFDRLEKSEYTLFMKRIWRYQWLKNKSELTNDILDKFDELTAGIIQRIILLYINVQIQAIENKTEIIDVELIEQVNNDKFSLTKPMINALVKNNIQALNEYEDLGYYENLEIYFSDSNSYKKDLDEINKVRDEVNYVINYFNRLNIDEEECEDLYLKIKSKNSDLSTNDTIMRIHKALFDSKDE